MCGRLHVHHDPLAQLVTDALGVKFDPPDSPDLRPSQAVSTLVEKRGGLAQLDCRWGIRPNWAKRDLINAQAETVGTKPTFRSAFASSRCVIPCSGWYEWSLVCGRKRKYIFRDAQDSPLYMAGIWYPGEVPRLVTLTTSPDEQCETYHHRMPLLIPMAHVEEFVLAPTEAIAPLLSSANPRLSIKECT